MYLELQTVIYIYINGCLVKASTFYVKCKDLESSNRNNHLYMDVSDSRYKWDKLPPVDGRTPAPARMYKTS